MKAAEMDVRVGNMAASSLTRSRAVSEEAKPKGRFVVQHWRNGKRINEFHFDNAVTTEGKNEGLNNIFKGVAGLSSWYLGLISSTGYTALAVTDTYAGINLAANGWTEFAGYNDNLNSESATTRPVWNAGTVSAASLTSGSVSIFDITAAGTVKGLFAVGGPNSRTKSDATSGNTLWATALFSAGDVTVASGDQLKVTYTVTMSS
jgi:hypothetical protein